MIDRLGSVLSYANVMSTIAVFAVLGGGAYAAGTIGAKDIKKNAVRAKHVKKNQIAAKHLKKNAVTGAKLAAGSVSAGKLADGAVTTGKLAAGAVTTGKLADGSVTGPKVDESTLGPVPDADRLDGLDSLDFVRGKGRSYVVRGTDSFGGPSATLAGLDVGGDLVLECRNPASVGSDVTFANTSGTPADVWTDRTQDTGAGAATTVLYSAVASGGTASMSVSGPTVDSGRNLLRFTIANGDRVTEVEARMRAVPGSACQLTALVRESRT
jgi:hypothetical protein